MNLSTNDSNMSEAIVCTPDPPPLEARFFIVVIVGSIFSVIGFFENVLLFYALLSRRKYRRSNYVYLIFLASADGFLCFSFTPLIAVDLLKDYVQIPALNRAWWSYFGPTLAACHIAMTSSCYVILVATFERFLITNKSPLLRVVRNHRPMIGFGAIFAAVLVKGPILFEVTLMHEEACRGTIGEYYPDLRPIVSTFVYGTIFRFFFRNAATVFAPFIALAYLNFCIVLTLRRQQLRARLFRFAATDYKVTIRAATRILILVVCTYLIANCLNIVVTLWEHIDIDSIESHWQFYVYSTDLVSVLTILSCALRLPIYWSCNRELRPVFLKALSQTLPCCFSRRKKLKYATTVARSATTRVPEEAPRDETQPPAGTEFDWLAVQIAVRFFRAMTSHAGEVFLRRSSSQRTMVRFARPAHLQHDGVRKTVSVDGCELRGNSRLRPNVFESEVELSRIARDCNERRWVV